MHLVQSGFALDSSSAQDLQHPPADIIFITSASSEMQLLSRARKLLPTHKKTTIRAVLLKQLEHDFSVDLYHEQTLKYAKIIIVRLLGGSSYWPYGVEITRNLAGDHCHICFLSGQDKDDDELKKLSTISDDMRQYLHDYCQEGGVKNYKAMLECCYNIIHQKNTAPSVTHIPKVGIYGKKYAKPAAILLCYRAFVHSGDMSAIDALQREAEQKKFPILVVYVTSLKNEESYLIAKNLIAQYPSVAVLINSCSFSISGGISATQSTSPFFLHYPVLQAVHASISHKDMAKTMRGLPARDTAMAVTLPELDGSILGATIATKEILYYDRSLRQYIVGYKPFTDGIHKIIDIACGYKTLQQTKNSDKKIAIILSNYPNSDGRLANGVGLDTPQSLVNILCWLREDGYNVGAKGYSNQRADNEEWMARIRRNITNYVDADKVTEHYLPWSIYNKYFELLPQKMQKKILKRWGSYKKSPYSDMARKAFKISCIREGNVLVCVQPSRGYEVDIEQTYHDTELPPTHYYIGFYAYLAWRNIDAYIHLGKHGNLEWLPGRALSQDRLSFPFALLASKPHAYPFIINDPGEGTQAKRRTYATIISHLMPPMIQAEYIHDSYQLEWQIDEYYHASFMDPARCEQLKRNILDTAEVAGLHAECPFLLKEDDNEKLQELDNYLCKLKDMQIRGGLHILGEQADAVTLEETLLHLIQYKRLDGKGVNDSIIYAIMGDVGLSLDKTDYNQLRHHAILAPYIPQNRAHISEDMGHKILRDYALDILRGNAKPAGDKTASIIDYAHNIIKKHYDESAEKERNYLLQFLRGIYVPAGPSGAPTRGKAEILPSGKNFYSVDIRAIPSPMAWRIGQESASNTITRHAQETGDYPNHIVLSCWGSANMRTSGDDVAQAMAFIGVEPVWDTQTGRVTGFNVIDIAVLGRPRIAVTLRVSGFFRDAFSHVIALFHDAVQAVIALGDEQGMNKVYDLYQQTLQQLSSQYTSQQAAMMAGFSVFSAAEGSYGMGLQQLLDTGHWRNNKDLAKQVLHWGHTAYSGDGQSFKAKKSLQYKMTKADAVVHNQDNREHDILDSDDYYQFEGGLASLIEDLSGKIPHIWHNDHSNPDKPVTKSLQEEIGTIIRSRAANPKWLNLIKNHGYKGAFELAATVDYLFAFAATTHCVQHQYFDILFDEYIVNDDTRNFIKHYNPDALQDILYKFNDALDRGLWQSRRNDITMYLDMYKDAS